MSSAFTGGLKVWEEVKAEHPKDTQVEIPTSPLTPAAAPPTSRSKAKKGPQFGRMRVTDGMTLRPSELSLDDRVTRALSIAEECIKPEELRALFEKKPHPVCYDGFEPSGRMHIAQGILKALNVNKLTSCGCVFVFWVADWFGMLNNKMGGDLEKIRKVGQYFVEVWKASGMDMTNVKFYWASDAINEDPNGYWLRVLDVARKSSVSRMKRCCQIMGRADGDDQPSAHILYPCMQCSDIFYIGADICQLGMDQRKVNMLARDYCDAAKIKNKPVIISHAMVPGLLEGQEKMSKSNPDSAIFMEDSKADIQRKIKKAFCPPSVVEGNPCVSYVITFVFGKYGEFEVQRKETDGGNIIYQTVEDFTEDYLLGALHPADLKANLSRHLERMIEPVRRHFETNKEAKELAAFVRKAVAQHQKQKA